MESSVQWYRDNWSRMRLAPLYAEILDIPHNESAAAAAIPSQASFAPSVEPSSYGGQVDYSNGAYPPQQSTTDSAMTAFAANRGPRTTIHHPYSQLPNHNPAGYPCYSNSCSNPSNAYYAPSVGQISYSNGSAFASYNNNDVQPHASTTTGVEEQQQQITAVVKAEPDTTREDVQNRSRSGSSPDPESMHSRSFTPQEATPVKPSPPPPTLQIVPESNVQNGSSVTTTTALVMTDAGMAPPKTTHWPENGVVNLGMPVLLPIDNEDTDSSIPTTPEQAD